MASVHLLFGEVGAAKLGFSPPTIDDVEPRPWYDDGGGREVSSGSRENFARLGQVALGDGIFFLQFNVRLENGQMYVRH